MLPELLVELILYQQHLLIQEAILHLSLAIRQLTQRFYALRRLVYLIFSFIHIDFNLMDLKVFPELVTAKSILGNDLKSFLLKILTLLLKQAYDAARLIDLFQLAYVVEPLSILVVYPSRDLVSLN